MLNITAYFLQNLPFFNGKTGNRHANQANFLLFKRINFNKDLYLIGNIISSTLRRWIVEEVTRWRK